MDANRLLQVFSESAELAVGSRNPSTAQSRFELTIEIYHQLMDVGLRWSLRKSVTRGMEIFVERFPSQLCMNEALGLCDKAGKAKTVNTQLKYLRQAKAILEAGLARGSKGHDNIRSIYDQVEEHVQRAERLQAKA